MTDVRRHSGADRSWWRVIVLSWPCPACGAAPDQPCITTNGHDSSEPHADRSRVASSHHWRAAEDDDEP